MNINTYSPKAVDISFGGQIDVVGWLTASISRNVDNTTEEVSADGDLSITYSSDQTGTFELEVQQVNNSVNAALAALQAEQDRLKKPIFYDITIKDKSGGVLAYLGNAYLKKASDQDLAQEAGSRTWMFFVSKLTYVPDPSGFEGAVGAIADGIAAASTLANNTTNRTA